MASSTHQHLAHVKALLDSLGVHYDSDDQFTISGESNLSVIMSLMNCSLQCLGAIRVLTQMQELRRHSMSLRGMEHLETQPTDTRSHDELMLRETFRQAANRVLDGIVEGTPVHDLDPAAYLLDCFPNMHTIGNTNWCPLQFAVLGDTKPMYKDLTGSSESATDNQKSRKQPLSMPETPASIKTADFVGNFSLTSPPLVAAPEPAPPPRTITLAPQPVTDPSSPHQAIFLPPSNQSLPSLSSISEVRRRIAAIQGITRLLPASVNYLDKDERTFIHYAARTDSPELVAASLAVSRPPINLAFANRNGALPLHNTARFSSSLPVLDFLIQAHPVAVAARNNEQLLPLHWAAAKSANPAIIDRLLQELPGSIKERNTEGCLPLHCAGQNTRLEVVRAVHARFPDAISMADHDGGYPLHHACSLNRSLEVVRFLYDAYPAAITIAEHTNQVTPLHLAAFQNPSNDVMRFILSQHPSAARLQDAAGWLPLHCLVHQRPMHFTQSRMDGLRLLLGAYPEAVAVRTLATANQNQNNIHNHNNNNNGAAGGTEGLTPVDMALQRGHGPAVLRLLLTHASEASAQANARVAAVVTANTLSRSPSRQQLPLSRSQSAVSLIATEETDATVGTTGISTLPLTAADLAVPAHYALMLRNLNWQARRRGVFAYLAVVRSQLASAEGMLQMQASSPPKQELISGSNNDADTAAVLWVFQRLCWRFGNHHGASASDFSKSGSSLRESTGGSNLTVPSGVLQVIIRFL